MLEIELASLGGTIAVFAVPTGREGTKIVFTGDPWQIDNPYVDANSNGFVYLVDRFRGQALSAHVHLEKGERSELAELAANLL